MKLWMKFLKKGNILILDKLRKMEKNGDEFRKYKKKF